MVVKLGTLPYADVRSAPYHKIETQIGSATAITTVP
jgi:hypothetical protein